MIYIQIIVAFVAMFFLDYVFALYTKKVIDEKPAQAGFFASAIVLCNAIVTINFVDNPWMIIPTLLGAFAGTWTAVRFH